MKPAKAEPISNAILLILALAAIAAIALFSLNLFSKPGSGPNYDANETNSLPIGGFVGNRAPELIAGGQWFNSPPLTLSSLRGKVVLVDFWTYTCINCIRTLPYIESWHEKYSGNGLVIIGVHTPEFSFEHDPANVQASIRNFGLKYAVMQDNDYATWSAYSNQFWPRKYLIDKNGVIRFDHIGEGGYEETEQKIVELLSEGSQKVEMKPANITPIPENLQPVTPEIYAGYSRAGALGNPEGYQPGIPYDYKYVKDLSLHRFYLDGKWNIMPEYSKYEGIAGNGSLALTYYAMSVNAVLKPSPAPFRANLLLDGLPLKKGQAGYDVKFDPDGTSYVQVDSPRLYNLVRTPDYGRHMLQLIPQSDSFSLYAFTFG